MKLRETPNNYLIPNHKRTIRNYVQSLNIKNTDDITCAVRATKTDYAWFGFVCCQCSFCTKLDFLLLQAIALLLVLSPTVAMKFDLDLTAPQ